MPRTPRWPVVLSVRYPRNRLDKGEDHMHVLAYLDANSGSLIASVVVAGFAGLAVWFKMGWHRAGRVFSPKRRRTAKAEAESDS